MLNNRIAFHGRFFRLFVRSLLLATAIPTFAAEPIIEHEVIARTGVTPIPNGVGTFSGFNSFPAIDDDGNVVFNANGGSDNSGLAQVGVYTAIGMCCQNVVDRNTPVITGVSSHQFIYCPRELACVLVTAVSRFEVKERSSAAQFLDQWQVSGEMIAAVKIE